jgi:hypothetical protein
VCFPCLAHAAQAGKTLFPLDWLNIAGSASFSTRPGFRLPRSQVQLPTLSSNIDPALVISIDENPLTVVQRAGYIWENKVEHNVSPSGTKGNH